MSVTATGNDLKTDEGLTMASWGKRSDLLVHEQEPYNAEPTSAALAGHYLTPIEAFYSRNHGPVPELEHGAWRLRVDGLVDTPLSLSLSDLQTRFEVRTLTATLQCAGNRRADLITVRDIPGEDPWRDGATSTAEWTGVRLGDVLHAAGLADAVAHVAFTAPDVSQLADPPQVFGGSIPRVKALSPEVLLVWQMNGRPLPAVHGGPVRVVVGGYIGARSVKWIERITAQTEPSDNYFQASAYRLLPADADPDTTKPGDGLSLGPIALNAAILSPPGGATVPAGPLIVRGYALAGEHRDVARVDVSGDGGGSWQQADLGDRSDENAWRQWQTTLVMPGGDAELVARAWDSTGALQPESPEAVWNPKGYVNNSWPRNQVHVEP